MNPDAQVFRDYCKRCNRAEQQTEREGMNQMVQRWKMSPNQSMVTEPDGGYVEYADHLAAIAEKDREIDIEYSKIFHIFRRQHYVIKEQEKLLDHKDREISDLKRGIERLKAELKVAYAIKKQNITVV